MIKAFKLTDLQAEAILNMRLRALRRLEEFEIKGEHKKLSGERKDLRALLKDDKLQWAKIAEEVQETKRKFGGKTELGRRRTELADAPAEIEHAVEDFVEREPITVVCSDKGWIRAAKGHLDDKAAAELKYKEGDGPRFAIHAQSIDKVLMFATNGRFYTLGCDRLPSARGHGEPVRLMIELGNEQDIVQLEVLKGGRKFLVASDAGRGFVVPEDEVVAQTKNGKQVLNLADKEKAQAFAVVPENADSGGGAQRRPQAPDLPARSGAGDGPRPRRAAAEIQGRQAVGCAGLPARRRPAVVQPDHPRRRAEILARRARPGGAHARKRLAARQALQGLIEWTSR